MVAAAEIEPTSDAAVTSTVSAHVRSEPSAAGAMTEHEYVQASPAPRTSPAIVAIR